MAEPLTTLTGAIALAVAILGSVPADHKVAIGDAELVAKRVQIDGTGSAVFSADGLTLAITAR